MKFKLGDRVMLLVDHSENIKAGAVGIIYKSKEVMIKNSFLITYYNLDVGGNLKPMVYEHQIVKI